LPGDMHLNCVLVGALADAMYGHQLYMRKQKFVSDNLGNSQNLDIHLLDFLREADRETWLNRTFFPKNNAETNVERHNWYTVPNHSLSGVHFSKEARRRMLKSCYTGWDNRYGLYWDDGWFYIYRSSWILGRFRLSKNSDGTYSIIHLQDSKANLNIDINTVLDEVIHTSVYGWLLYGDEDLATTVKHMFKFYHGEEDAPTEIASQYGKWWLWEKMAWENFERTEIKIVDDWLFSPADFWQSEFPGFCPEEWRLLDFFANLHGKWIPYHDEIEAVKEEYIKY